MKTTKIPILLRFIASAISGGLLVLAFPEYDLGWMGWVALVPLITALHGSGMLSGFFLAYTCGMVFFSGYGSWLFEINSYRLVHHVCIDIYLAAYFGLFGLLFAILSKRFNPGSALLLAPMLWVSQEYARSHVGFLSLPYGLLGHAQYQNLPILQLSRLTGVYGISFLSVMFSATLAAVILSLFHRISNQRWGGDCPISKKQLVRIVAATVVLSGAVFWYGVTQLTPSNIDSLIRVSVLQGNIEQTKKWDPKFSEYIWKTYTELSLQATADHPALIVWPEASTPGFVLKNSSHYRRITSLIKATQTHHLVGSSEYPKFEENDPVNDRKGGNTAIFFSPQAKVLGQYLKIRLVPFAEYIPYEGRLRWPNFIVPKGKKISQAPGSDITVFEINNAKFGVVICWESLFPSVFRKFVQQGTNFMVNISNEAWFGEATFSHQFLAINVFRAVENGVPQVRAGNSGVSCFIDENGRIYSRLRDKNDNDLHFRGYLTAEVALSSQRTFYTSYGDVFVYLCLAFSGLAILAAVVTSGKPHDAI